MPKLYRQPCLERGEEEVQKGGDGSGGMWAGSPDLQRLQHPHCSSGGNGAGGHEHGAVRDSRVSGPQRPLSWLY